MDNILNNLGLCNRAGKIISGTDEIIDEMRLNKVYLIFLASDASDNTKKKINDKAKYYGVDIIDTYSSIELSNAIGKTNRMVIGIIDKGFVKILKK